MDDIVGVMALVGDIILFMLTPMPGRVCGEKDEWPIPGLMGAMAGNDEFSVLIA